MLLKVIGRSFVVTALSLAGFTATAAAATYLWWTVTYPTYSHRYRLTVEVQKGAERFRGEGVIAVDWASQPEGFMSPWSCRLRGDAVVVELGDRRMVAMLQPAKGYTAQNDPCYLTLQTFGQGAKLSHDMLAAQAKNKGQVAVDPGNYPSFAMFSDEKLPSTAVEVLPADFPSYFGAKLVGVWLEITDDPITRGVVTKIPAVEKLVAASRVSSAERGRAGVSTPYASHFTRGN